jgi:hypothetical protein
MEDNVALAQWEELNELSLRDALDYVEVPDEMNLCDDFQNF